ncbi:ABC-F family ATP-binding cassette domain-containing protein [Rossellomorea vietnamensis]|uniref:ABC-F family ATP-binding cassette domain-containing protein n=1 Tax=Rossellomorea vietnamensis TaxID=218284 RepID=A0A5D4MKM3_9BACI|nr:ATP-binding cassette domain-containing protein [Rossellomorea vietnamensis]TYS01546.1 ABC-F family ATP-binding cassette domain-containing protein [Rossellomorea vietnamensis]
MLLMRAKNVVCTIGEKTFFDEKELTIYQGDKIGLIGRNGEGKSLLLKYLQGMTGFHPNVEWFCGIGYMEQLSVPSKEAYLSGGELTIKKLNSLLSEGHRLLFLDEPSNNLDWDRMEELQKRLKSFNGSIILASHDRSLLDTVCTKIWELDDGRLKEYQGNYEDYLVEKEREKKEQEAKYESYSKEKKRLLERYDKKQRQAQGMDKPPSRMGNSEWQLYKGKAAGKRGKVERVSTVIKDRIERMEEVEKPFEWDAVKMEYVLQSPIHRKTLLTAKNLTKYLGGEKLYESPHLKLKTGSKTACIGRNGCGKTTLIRQLLEEVSEKIDMSKSVKAGYFEQSLQGLPDSSTILEFVTEGSTIPKHVIRIILARLRFFEEDVHKPISVLSGGERVKTAIAKLLVGDYNLLVLDEPTNHVDLDTLQALEGLLRDYPGTVLLVSHDRRFVENVADKLWRFHDRTISMFDGGLKQLEGWTETAHSLDENEEEILKLETKLTELIGRLSLPSPADDVTELDRQYKSVLTQLKQLKQ